jgi:hypothetical protein
MEESGNLGFLPFLENNKPVTVKKGPFKKTKTNQCIGADVLRAIETLSAKKAGKDAAP